MERRASEEESLIIKSDPQDALKHAIKAAELYMGASREAEGLSNRSRIRAKIGEMITLAEYLKGSITGEAIQPKQDRQLSSRETVTLLQSSKLNGTEFLPWRTSHGAPEAFALKSGKGLYVDSTPFSLSKLQLENFEGWKRPRDLLSSLEFMSLSESSSSQYLQVLPTSDLVQDVTADCSVVASLCSAMRLLCRKERSLLRGLMFPFDTAHKQLIRPENGKYVFRMNFNGCFRRVEIDDRLPAAKTDRALFVTDRRNPFVIWPALIEKAYLKIRGGYDFPGSNSCTDLWVLTGWVPQQIFLQRDALNLEQEWDTIVQAFKTGNVIVTLGTGRISKSEEQATGLVGEHDYGILDVDSDPVKRRLLVKNPWRTGEIWNELGSTSVATPITEESDAPTGLHDQTGAFWMSLADVTQHFESMYLNWNPALFRNRQDYHFTWDLKPRKNMSATVVDNPQYSITATGDGSVWVLLARHFTDLELDLIKKRSQTPDKAGLDTGFMSIYVFEDSGTRVPKLTRNLYHGPFVDSPQTLLKFRVEKGKSYTVVPVQEKLSMASCNFTLSFFTNQSLAISPAKDAMRHSTDIPSSWTRRTAGGNSGSVKYGTNPQFSITLTRQSALSLLLCTDSPDIPVHIDLVWANGERVGPSLAIKDVLADSDAYVRGCAVLDVPSVDPGTYTAVCSTFETGQIADFTFRVSSSAPHVVRAIPSEGSGRLRTQMTPFVFAEGESALRAPVRVNRLTRMCAAVRRTTVPSAHDLGPRRSSTPLKIAVVTGRGPRKHVLGVSGGGEYTEPTAELRTPDFDVEPGRAVDEGGLWVVVERVGGNQSRETFQVELLGDAPITVGGWEDAS
ncbi:hypothetical protein jhhlp_000239 [Lomentospora prolificans]|uniref:Calpain catalytic domain-containing protein n=1 Tax=Lomentospora prolificans TaxID=41688 RepID=A0A2N3NKE5_9PEZI|nr:hypothetical protein jhhlp_000239 [Lomentospora prolificans]